MNLDRCSLDKKLKNIIEDNGFKINEKKVWLSGEESVGKK